MAIAGYLISNYGAIVVEGSGELAFNASVYFATHVSDDDVSYSGYLSTSADSIVYVRADFCAAMNGEDWSLAGTIIFKGYGTEDDPQLLRLLEDDQGYVDDGFDANEAFACIEITNGTYVQIDTDSERGTALYILSLTVDEGATFDLQDYNLYAKTSEVEGSVISGMVTRRRRQSERIRLRGRKPERHLRFGRKRNPKRHGDSLSTR